MLCRFPALPPDGWGPPPALDSAAAPLNQLGHGTGPGLPFPGTGLPGAQYQPVSHFPGTASPPLPRRGTGEEDGQEQQERQRPRHVAN